MRGILLSGVHCVRAALAARRRELFELTLRAGRRGLGVEELGKAATAAGVAVRELEPEAFSRLAPAGAPTPGGRLRAGELPEAILEELSDPPGPRTLVALDGVEDPQNLGALARVAEGAGATGLILTRRRSPPLTAAVSRASAGAIEWLPAVRVPNLSRVLNLLKKKEFWVYGADSEGPGELWRLPDRAHASRRVVVLGAEGRGLRPGVVAELDHRVRIPLRGRVESLNVATAAAVVLFELVRRDAAASSSGGDPPALPRV